MSTEESKYRNLSKEQQQNLISGYRQLEELILLAKARTAIQRGRLQNAKTNLEQVLESQKNKTQ